MSWIKLHDGFYDHAVIRRMTASEMGLYMFGLGYSNRNLQDGELPRSALLHRLVEGGDPIKTIEQNEADINCLVSKGALLARQDGVLVIIHFTEFCDTKSSIEEKKSQISEIRSVVGRVGGLRSGEVRRNKQLDQTKNTVLPKQNGTNEAPLLSSPHRSTPHRTEEGSPKSFPLPEIFAGAPTRTHTSGAAPTPEPGPEAPAPAAHPVRLVPKLAVIPLTAAGFHDKIIDELREQGASPEQRRAAMSLHLLLSAAAGGELDLRDSVLQEWSWAIKVAERSEMITNADARQAKVLLGKFMAMLDAENKARGIA